MNCLFVIYKKPVVKIWVWNYGRRTTTEVNVKQLQADELVGKVDALDGVVRDVEANLDEKVKEVEAVGSDLKTEIDGKIVEVEDTASKVNADLEEAKKEGETLQQEVASMLLGTLY